MPASTHSGRSGSRSRVGLLRSVVGAVRTTLRPGTPGLGERGHAVPRLVRAVVRGEYAHVSRGHLTMMALAAFYIVSPVDLVPEGVLGLFGLADDALVATWLAAALVHDTEDFLTWERTRTGGTTPPQDDRPGPRDASGRPQDSWSSTSSGPAAGGPTVRSHIVP